MPKQEKVATPAEIDWKRNDVVYGHDDVKALEKARDAAQALADSLTEQIDGIVAAFQAAPVAVEAAPAAPVGRAPKAEAAAPAVTSHARFDAQQDGFWAMVGTNKEKGLIYDPVEIVNFLTSKGIAPDDQVIDGWTNAHQRLYEKSLAGKKAETPAKAGASPEAPEVSGELMSITLMVVQPNGQIVPHVVDNSKLNLFEIGTVRDIAKRIFNITLLP